MIGLKSGMRIILREKEQETSPWAVFLFGCAVVLFTVGVFLIGTELGGF